MDMQKETQMENPKEKVLRNVPGFIGQDFVIRKFKWKHMLEIQARGIKTDLSEMIQNPQLAKAKGGAGIKIDVDIQEMKFSIVYYGLKKAPFLTGDGSKKRQELEETLETEAGEFLYNEIQEFNKSKLDETQKKN